MKHGRITIEDDEDYGCRFVIEAPAHVSIRLRRLFGGAQRYKAGIFKLAATPVNAYDLEWFSERHPMDIDPDSAARFKELVAAHARKLDKLAELEAESYTPREFELAIPPRDYQRADAELALLSGSLLIASDLGVGKTCSCICAMTTPGALPAVVVTMKHLVRQWAREIRRFAPNLRIHAVRSRQPYSFREIKIELDPLTRKRRLVKYNGVPDVIILSYSKLDGWVETLSGVAKSLVMDEAQEFRHSGTRKYDAGKALAQAVDLRIAATATPIYGYGHEIFNVMEVIAPGQLGTWKEFLDEWCGGSVDAQGRATVYDPAALGTYLRESGLMIRRTRKDVGREIPPVTIVRHEVESDQTAINRVADDVAELAKRILSRLGTGIERMGYARDIDYMMRQATGIAKAGAVVEFVRILVEAGERVLLGTWHHAVNDLITSAFDRLKITHALYTGQQSDAQKEEARQAFCDGKIDVLILSNRSGAGLDGLQYPTKDGKPGCRTVVIAELDWSPQVIQQFIGRAARDGQTDPVMAYILVTDSGSDPVISDALGIKEAQSHYLLNPDATGMPEFQGTSDDHIRKLAESIMERHGKAAFS